MMIANDISELKRSALFAMSLGSKELFHSNVWAWLIERDPAFADVFFMGIANKGKLTVVREEQKRDVTIWVDKGKKTAKAYVIENKFKAIPYAAQLQRYRDGLGKKFARGLVTGIERPNWSVEEWSFRDFGEINKQIEKVASTSKALNPFAKELTLQYCKMVRALLKILKCFIKNSGNKLVTTVGRRDLEIVRLGDLAGKLLGERFVEYLKNDNCLLNIKKQVEALKLHFLILPDFFKKNVVIDVRIVADDRSREEVEKDHGARAKWLLGIQIEDCAYSRCAQVGCQVRLHGQIADCATVFQLFNQKGWLQKKTMLPGKSLKKRVDFGTYRKQGVYHFVYQPYKVDNLSFKALRDKIVADMNVAINIASSICCSGEL